MKIILAPDSYKGSVSSVLAAEAIEKGVRRVFPQAEIIKIPVADGGEGTAVALVSAVGGRMRQIEVTGPLGKKITAEYGLLKDGAAVIEMAAASGLPLIPEEKRDPMVATSFGTGEMVCDALDLGCKKIMIGIGGSATNDGGVGMAQALGVSFRDEDGNELLYGGGSLGTLKTIDLERIHPKLVECEIIAACDVKNPLCGPAGASAVYGPQKGATPEMVKELDANLGHLADIIKKQLGKDVRNVEGAGAAGGLGAGLIAFCGAALKPGIETVLDIVEIDRHLADADLVITGEGRIDGQSVFGKVPVGIGGRAAKFHVPVLAVVGGIGDGTDAVYDYGVSSVMSIVNAPMPLDEAVKNAEDLIEDAAGRAMRMIKIGMDIKKRNQKEGMN